MQNGDGGKQVSTILKNVAPILVATFTENGGLKNVLFLFLFFLVFCLGLLYNHCFSVYLGRGESRF